MNLSNCWTLRAFISLILAVLPTKQSIFEKVWKMETCGPPEIQNTMMNQTKYPGESASFKCQIDMSKCMVAFIDWYHLRINASEREKIKSARRGDPHTHTIDNVDMDHEGLYTCVVGNVLGRAEASAYLSVQSSSSRRIMPSALQSVIFTMVLWRLQELIRDCVTL